MNSWDCPAVDASDVTVKRRVQPRFPAAAMETGQPGDVTCVLVFRIDETGKPVDLEIEESCPAVYHDSDSSLLFFLFEVPTLDRTN